MTMAMNAAIEDLIEGFNQPTYRGVRINGQRVAKGRPSDCRGSYRDCTTVRILFPPRVSLLRT